MSSFVFMKLLETQASRYDAGISMLSFGRVHQLYQSIAERVPHGSRVLEVGCGTGNLTRLLAERGCQVTGMDLSPSMLAVAEQKLQSFIQQGQVELRHLGVTEMDRAFADGTYTFVVSCLVFSELSKPEQDFAIRQIRRVLQSGGQVIIGDEVVPSDLPRRLLYYAYRLPVAALTYLVTQTTTHAVKDLPSTLQAQGFQVEVTAPSYAGAFQVVHGQITGEGSERRGS